jgi:hypothetical protein
MHNRRGHVCKACLHLSALLDDWKARSVPRRHQTWTTIRRLRPELNYTPPRSLTGLSTCLNPLEVGFLILRSYSSLIGPRTQPRPLFEVVVPFLLYHTRPIASHVLWKLNYVVQQEAWINQCSGDTELAADIFSAHTMLKMEVLFIGGHFSVVNLVTVTYFSYIKVKRHCSNEQNA